MKRDVFKPTFFSVLLTGISHIFFTLAVMSMIIYGLDRTERSTSVEGRRLLEEAIRRAAVTCYAVEGSYPDSVAYMEEHYGIHVNRAKYAVYYEIFASNILPEITVVQLAG